MSAVKFELMVHMYNGPHMHTLAHFHISDTQQLKICQLRIWLPSLGPLVFFIYT